MREALGKLSVAELDQLTRALRSGRLKPPYNPLGLQRYVSQSLAVVIAPEIQKLADEGMSESHLALLFEYVAVERSGQETARDGVELVWTGPDEPGMANRDTIVVVSELFSKAEESVVVAGYAVYQGKEVFSPLAAQMEEIPSLKVRMFLDISRPRGDTSLESEILRRYAHRFRKDQWPGSKFPEVWYDPRALEMNQAKRACLHAKCIVIDEEVSFVSSANFTEAAQLRNIEVGVLIKSHAFSEQLACQFEVLSSRGVLRRLDLS